MPLSLCISFIECVYEYCKHHHFKILFTISIACHPPLVISPIYCMLIIPQDLSIFVIVIIFKMQLYQELSSMSDPHRLWRGPVKFMNLGRAVTLIPWWIRDQCKELGTNLVHNVGKRWGFLLFRLTHLILEALTLYDSFVLRLEHHQVQWYPDARLLMCALHV